MSEELIDDSILNADGSNGSNVGEGGGGSNIDLNEDQIAELLGDNSTDTVEENITTSESQEEIREAVLTDFEGESSEVALEEGRAEDLQIPVVEMDQDVLLANVSSQNVDEGYDENDLIIEDEVEEIQVMDHQNVVDFVEEEGVSEEVLIDDGEVAERQENTLLGQEMEHIFEHDDDVIPMEADDIENASRKRAGGDKSAPSPVPKRQRRVQTCFELRQQWIEMVSRLYGSWDAQISISNLQFIKNLSIANQRRLIDVHIQNENILKTEIRSLREQLLQERRAHTATRVALKTLTEDANVMRKQLGKLSDMITQPITAKLLNAFFPRNQTDHDTDNTPPRSHPNVLATAQQSACHVPLTVPSQSRPFPQKPIYSTLERAQSLTSKRQYAKSYINMVQRTSTHVPKKQSSLPEFAPLSNQPSSLPKAQDSYSERQESFQGSCEPLSDITPCLQEENPSKLLQESSSSRKEINFSLVEVQPSMLTKPHLPPNIPRSLHDVQTLIDFMEWFPTDRELLPELMRIGVIMRRRQCTNCGREMKISFKKGVYQWRCRERNRDCSCKSVKSDSWFQNQGVSLGKSVRFLICWSSGMSGPDMHRELNMSNATIAEWKNMCRHLCLRVCRKLPMIGGPDTVVEIGLTFRQPKKTVGEEAAKEPVCILGAIERESRKCFATIAPNQTTHCLISILTQAVRQDSIVVTDELTALDDMDIHFRRHESVCHSRNFQGKSSDGLAVDTNTISSFWRAMGNGTTEELFPSYIAEFVSREWYGIDLWKRLLEEIRIASAVPQNHFLDASIRPAGVVLPPARIHPSRAPAPPRSVSIKWQAIPPPQNGNLGHTEPQLPGNCRQPLIDTTKQGDNTIMLCIPLVSPHNIISSGDSSRLPVGPKIYQGIQANPDLTVTIHSTSQDFRENYQIGGKVNYEYLGNLDQKSVQILVQVSSLKFSGMHGKPDPAIDIPIDWGCSNLWPCKSKSHKFRVKFHHQQLLPVHDRITVVVVVRDTINDSLEISQPAFLNLE